MSDISIKKVIQTALVTAFTFAVALIWKETILESIHYFFPTGPELFYKFLVAVIATLIIIIAIFLIYKTEEETEFLIKKYRGKYFLQKVKTDEKEKD